MPSCNETLSLFTHYDFYLILFLNGEFLKAWLANLTMNLLGYFYFTDHFKKHPHPNFLYKQEMYHYPK